MNFPYKQYELFLHKLNWEPSDALPMTLSTSRGGQFVMGLIFVPAGLFLLLLSIFLFVLSFENHQIFDAKLTFVELLVFTATAALLKYAWDQFFRSETVTISQSDVEFEIKTPWSCNHWKEPLDSYQGILPYHHLGSSRGAPLWMIVLKHALPEKSIPLYFGSSRRDEDFENSLFSYADMLRLPIINQ